MRTTVYRLAIIICFAALVISCKKNHPEDGGISNKHDDYKLNEWIYGIMKSNYLWNNEITTNPDYNQGYDTFFNSLLKKYPNNSFGDSDPHDGTYENGRYRHYSYTSRTPVPKSRGITGENSLGFDMVLSQGKQSNNVYAIVTYVVNSSPAEQAGIKRGDIISKIDGEQPTLSTYEDIYLSKVFAITAPKTTTFERCKVINGSLTTLEVVSMTPRTVDVNPVAKCDKITDYPGHVIGYLHYAEFESGPNGDPDDNKYVVDLKRAFAYLNQQPKVTDLVIDLRYNGGGYVYICQLLASMITSGRDGNLFAYMKDNKNERSNIDFLSLNDMSVSDWLGSEEGTQLGMTKVYFLTTNSTASASELAIYGLRGVGLDIVTIGETTEGKNVGSVGFDSDKAFNGYNYHLQPITTQVFDVQNRSAYSHGITPNHELYEFSDIINLKNLGDPNEVLLAKAISLITGNPVTASTPSRSENDFMHVIGSSSDFKRKSKEGLILVPGIDF